jgi:hypothetical protein
MAYILNSQQIILMHSNCTRVCVQALNKPVSYLTAQPLHHTDCMQSLHRADCMHSLHGADCMTHDVKLPHSTQQGNIKQLQPWKLGSSGKASVH